MDTQTILASLRDERERLSQAIAALEALNGAGKRRGRPPGRRRRMSDEAKAKIAAAQRRRWAAQRKKAA